MRTILLFISIFLLAACNSETATSPDQETASADTDTPAATEPASEDAQAETTQPEEEATASPKTAETRDREAPHLEPAFAGQTRAPIPDESEDWTLETVTEGLEHPWAIEFLPDGSMLVTERPGRLRHVSADGNVSEPLAGVPEVDNRSQGGLLDVAIAPDFESSRTIFLSFSEPHEDGTNNTALARARLKEDRSGLEDIEVIFSQQPAVESTGHFGSRIVFEDEDTLWLTMGDRQGHPVRQNAQDPTNHIGTIVRLNFDGSVPQDNPFVDHEQNAPEIWSYGHRNIQAAAKDSDGTLWAIEHGPRGGDELNRPEAGKNYGWPTISYGIEYRGGDVYEGRTEAEGMEQPIYFWDPVIAPSGMDFYTGEAFEAWQGDLFVGGLREERVSRLVLDGNRVVGEEWLEIGSRVRDVKTGPDGAIYLVTDESDGQVLRIVPDNG
ncbi:MULTISPECIES: PQQ-dependent sugar dehydrogenase [unclassified Wenzhouxiangella]|uniref:PQQ-dependent sugar dehydrogenase n=1 Tax=unclassified Wenzhouxiangella TaxID=2613841 RepID=UPI000E32ABE0|nr:MULTISPECIES: PQQ-dependent sugar dehydrogenase [unclassified Wenzhouxiangella]RFF28949.1 PQQ-dependent sugar dehydrogenase [Wenzhouxiangella sp. 15181]RFP68342.1 PQQ-dependent sugar dehydrogenase [Wenzhouxiangella sp. 15190]